LTLPAAFDAHIVEHLIKAPPSRLRAVCIKKPRHLEPITVVGKHPEGILLYA